MSWISTKDGELYNLDKVERISLEALDGEGEEEYGIFIWFSADVNHCVYEGTEIKCLGVLERITSKLHLVPVYG